MEKGDKVVISIDPEKYSPEDEIIPRNGQEGVIRRVDKNGWLWVQFPDQKVMMIHESEVRPIK